MEVDDRELWARVRAGDGEAFGVLYERHVSAVYNFCFRRTAHVSSAEDLSSAVFVEAWELRERTELTRHSALPWLLGVAHNLLRNHWRSARRRRAALQRLPVVEATEDHAGAVAERIDAERRMRAVRAAVDRLPEREQRVIELCVWSGLAPAEAAEVLGVAVGTVHSRLHRGRARLAAMVREAAVGGGHEQGRNTRVFRSGRDVMEVCDGA